MIHRRWFNAGRNVCGRRGPLLGGWRSSLNRQPVGCLRRALGPGFRACRQPLLAAAVLLSGWAGGPTATATAEDGFRTLAPGVLTVVPPDRSADEAVTRGPLLEITEGLKDLRWTPARVAASTTLTAQAGRLEYPRDIWCLEFSFKAPRRMVVEVPAPDGRMRKATVWYLVYRVRNVGGRRVLVGENDDGEPDPTQRTVEEFQEPVRFLPHFVLESREGLSSEEGLVTYRGYLDRLMPAAMDAIRRREDPARTFLDSAAMAATEIQPGEERWGVATWEGIDPRIDYFSIFVRGLTNATRWRKKPGSVIGPNDPPGSKMEQTLESLRLDFWRPGEADGDEDIQIGYRGMFERMALGGSILKAVNWPEYARCQPAVGLRRAGLAWSDPGLQEPVGQGAATSYLPVATVLTALDDMADSAVRNMAAREMFGDFGVEAIGQLVVEAGGQVSEPRDRERRAALEPMGLAPEDFSRRPLQALAGAIRGLDDSADLATRRRRAAAVFGEAAGRLDWLRQSAIQARVLATLDVTAADPAALGRLDARDAFEAVADAVDDAKEEDRPRILVGLFGPLGPELFSQARAVHEGVYFSWGHRYEYAQE
jgi:hypothetical protein